MSESPVPDLATEIQDDRRLEERQRVHWPIRLRWTAPGGLALSHGETTNLSLNGIHLAADRNLNVGQLIAWRLTVHPWHGNTEVFEIEGSAKVTHCAYSSAHGGFDIGLQFQAFAGDGKMRVAKLIADLQKGVPTGSVKIIHGMQAA